MRRHSWDLPIIYSWCVIPRLLLNSILMVFWLWMMSWWKRLWLFIRTSNDPTEQHDSKQEPCQGPEARVSRGCNDSNMNRLGAHDLFRWNRVNMRTTPIKWQHVSSGVGQHQHVRGVVNGQYQQHGSGDIMEKFFKAMSCSSGWDDIHDRHCL